MIDASHRFNRITKGIPAMMNSIQMTRHLSALRRNARALPEPRDDRDMTALTEHLREQSQNSIDAMLAQYNPRPRD